MVKLQFIAPGEPIQNAYIESFNARLREERFNEHVSLRSMTPAARSNAGASRTIGSDPNFSLGNLTPEEFAAKAKAQGERRPRAPLGQRNKSWSSWRTARLPRSQNLTGFRPPSDCEGRPEETVQRKLTSIEVNQNRQPVTYDWDTSRGKTSALYQTIELRSAELSSRPSRPPISLLSPRDDKR
jgi:integrase-like protein